MKRLIPLTLKEANRFILENHRHHKAIQGCKFSIGLKENDKLIGVAVCGRPVSRFLDNGLTLEITRLCTLQIENACSKLISACARIAKEMGYDKIQTYILENETGVSLKASGWFCEDEHCGGKTWNCKARPRKTNPLLLFYKKRFVKYLAILLLFLSACTPKSYKFFVVDIYKSKYDKEKVVYEIRQSDTLFELITKDSVGKYSIGDTIFIKRNNIY